MRLAAPFWWFCTLALVVVVPLPARAGGLELGPGGTASVMRGGAVAARPEDATLMLHNPAGTAFLSGDQITFDLDFTLRTMCVDPYGYYGWGVYQYDGNDPNDKNDFGDPLAVKYDDDGDPIIGATYATTPLPKVCNSGDQIPIPNLAWVGKLSDDFALGIGFVAPTLVAGMRFGGRDGTIQVGDDPRPTPTRYVLVDQSADAFAPSVSAAYRLIPQLSVGATLTLVMLNAKSRVVQNATSGTQPARDWLVDLEAKDYFLPTVTISAHLRPFRGLDAMAGLRWVDDLDGTGKVSFETGTFHQSSTAGTVPYRNDAIKLSSVRVGLPWAVTAAVRYSGQLPAPPAGDKETHLGDPIDTDLWDVEVDGTYNLNERGGANRVKVGGDVRIVTRSADGGGALTAVTAEKLEEESVPRHLEDSIALRLGGSFSLLPRRFQVHGGVFYENRGVDPSYANIDSFAFARVGMGLGVMWRVGDFDLAAAYGHIFQKTMRIAPPEHDPAGFDQTVGGSFDIDGSRIGGDVLRDPDAPAPDDADAVAKQEQQSPLPSEQPGPRIINAGEYTASFNIISIGAVYHF